MSKLKSMYNPEEALEVFHAHKNDINEHEYYKAIYEEIYNYYKDKDRHFLNIEKVRVKGKFHKNSIFSSSLIFSFLILGIIFLVNNLIVALSQTYLADKIIIVYGISFIIYSLVLFIVFKSMKKKDTFIFDITLQIIADLEKEFDDEFKVMLKANAEAAATVEEDVKGTTYKSDGNFNLSISTPQIFDIAFGMYKGIKFISNLFGKKKRK